MILAREGWSALYEMRTVRSLALLAVTYTSLTKEPCTVFFRQVPHEPPITKVSGTKRALTCARHYFLGCPPPEATPP